MSTVIHLKPLQDRECYSDILEDWQAGLPFQGQDGHITIHDRHNLRADGYHYAHVTYADNCRVLMINL